MLLLSLRLIKNDNELGKGQHVPFSTLWVLFSVFLAVHLSYSSLYSSSPPFLQPLSPTPHHPTPPHASLSLYPSLSPSYWKDPGQITKKAIFIYELQDLIDTYFMPSKSTLYYCCLCDLFILLWNIPSVEGGKCTGCNSPWTSIILDFSTGWSSMQKGHFLSTKIKTIMMIKKTCVLFVLV